MQIKDRTFIISGGASGLGLATVRDLHSRGGYIAILDLNADSGAQIVSELGSDRTIFFETDMADPASTAASMEKVVAWLKKTGKPIGGVIPAAGVGMPGKLIDRHNEPIDLSRLEFVLNINVRGVLDLIRLSLPHMTKTETSADGERGVIILVSSSAAYDGQPGQVAYAASKGAVRSMALVLARDLAQYGIRCVAIAPGYFESAMTAAMSEKVRKSLERVLEFPARPGKGEDFAGMVRHIIENVMLNGECVRLDGATRMPSRM